MIFLGLWLAALVVMLIAAVLILMSKSQNRDIALLGLAVAFFFVTLAILAMVGTWGIWWMPMNSHMWHMYWPY